MARGRSLTWRWPRAACRARISPAVTGRNSDARPARKGRIRKPPDGAFGQFHGAIGPISGPGGLRLKRRGQRHGGEIMAEPPSCGECLVRLLEQHRVEFVFGIPGTHTLELYRGLARSSIRHIQPRHEQGAGFMADGYARASGRPGVCFLIAGPGLLNAATAIAQAYSDSIPMLVISSVAATSD